MHIHVFPALEIHSLPYRHYYIPTLALVNIISINIGLHQAIVPIYYVVTALSQSVPSYRELVIRPSRIPRLRDAFRRKRATKRRKTKRIFLISRPLRAILSALELRGIYDTCSMVIFTEPVPSNPIFTTTALLNLWSCSIIRPAVSARRNQGIVATMDRWTLGYGESLNLRLESDQF